MQGPERICELEGTTGPARWRASASPSAPRTERTTTGCPCGGIRRGNDPAKERQKCPERQECPEQRAGRRRTKPSPAGLGRAEESNAQAEEGDAQA